MWNCFFGCGRCCGVREECGRQEKAGGKRKNRHTRSRVETGASQAAGNILYYKDLQLDLDSQSVRRNGEWILLTRTEFQLLELFFSHPKKIFSLENIYQSLWQEEAVGDGAIMAHIKNLRKKLSDSARDPKYIKTAWGKGYYADCMRQGPAKKAVEI